MPEKHALISAFVVALSICTGSAFALEYQLEIDTALEHSDNVQRASTNERSDLDQRIELGISIEEQTNYLNALADYRGRYSDYKNNELEDESFIEGQAIIKWSPLPKTFEWDLFTSTRYLQRDRRMVDILNNREKRTIVSSGPVFISRLSSVDSLQLSGRFTTTTLEDSEQSENDRISAGLDWIHRLSSTREFAVGFEYAETDFDQTVLPDIENSSAYLTYNSILSSSQFRIKAGYNQSKRDLQDDVSGPLLEMAIEFRPANQEISFTAVNLITDSTIGLGTNPTLIDGNINSDDSNFNAVDIVERLFSELRYVHNALCSACIFTAAVIYDEQDFDVQLRDETSLNLELSSSYRISSTINAGLYLTHQAIDFKDVNRQDDIDRVRLRVEYSATGLLTLYSEIEAAKRESDDDDSDYEELAAAIGLRYRFR